MTLIDRYLNAVRGFLPPSEADDIIRELEDDIRSHAADLEEELGRPLTAADEEALLARFGNPVRLAARYRPQRHLIGSAMFPFYAMVLKVSLGVALLVHVVIAGVTLAAGGAAGAALAPLFIFPFTIAVTVFGWVTIVFALLDLNLDQLAGVSAWKDGTLPRPFAETVQSRVSLLCEIAATTVALLWWLAIPHAPFLILGPTAHSLQPGPVWTEVYPAIAFLMIATLAGLWAVLLHPSWNRYRPAAGALGNLAGLVIAFVLLQAYPLVTLIDPAATSPAMADAARMLNGGARVGLGVFAAFSAWELGVRLLRLGQRRVALPRP